MVMHKVNHKIKTGLVLLTCLPPTKGHKALIDYAVSYLDEFSFEKAHLFVVLCTQPDEPLTIERHLSVDLMIQNSKVHSTSGRVSVHFTSIYDPMPQYPKSDDDHQFWNTWKEKLEYECGMTIDYIFSSETYGIQLSEVMNSEYVPFDLGRTLINVSATNIRTNPIQYGDQIDSRFMDRVKKTFTIFGAESTGKSTLMNQLIKDFSYTNKNIAVGVDEWARPYLESIGNPAITDDLMEKIVRGQKSIENVAYDQNRLITIRDTDLLSTIGYYRLYCPHYSRLPGYTKALVSFHPADHYYLLESNIPFQPDPLRYGIDKRESADSFWENLLIEFGCEYTLVKDRNVVYDHIVNIVKDQEIFRYQRDKQKSE